MSASQKKNYYKQSRVLENRDEHSIVYWCVIGFALMFLLIAPFQTALFYGFKAQYERPVYSALLWASIALMLLAVFLFSRWKLREIRDGYALAIWALPLSYLLSMFTAASDFNARNLFLLHVMYAVFFLIGLYFARSKTGSVLLQQGIVVSAYAVVIYCYLNMFGNTYFLDAVMREGENSVRLTSVFQYANAYAGFLIIPILCGLYLIVSSRKWYVTAVHSLMVVPVLLSFFLTLSRGGLLMLPLILLAFLPFLSFARQMLFFLYLIIGSAASFLIADKTRSVTLEVLEIMVGRRNQEMKVDDPLSLFDPLSLSGWGTLLAASAAAAVVITLFHHFAAPYLEKGLERISKAKLANLYVPILILLASVLGVIAISGNSALVRMLPDAMAERVGNISLRQHSVLERLTMYRDTFKALADYPVFGAGGGAWGQIYPKYANNPYTVNQVHSFLLQYMVEIGIFGLLVLLALLGSILFLFAKRYFAASSDDRERGMIFYAAVIAILLHSLMDFEMSYAFISALVFLSLGGMAAGFDGPFKLRNRSGSETVQASSGKTKADSGGNWAPYLHSAFLGVSAVALFITSAVLLKANRDYYAAHELNRNGRPLQEVMAPLNEAVEAQKGNPYYALTKATFMLSAFDQTQDEQYLKEGEAVLTRIRQSEPYDLDLFNTHYNLLLAGSRWDELVALLDQGVQNYPWMINVYERAAILHFQQGDVARMEEKADIMNHHFDAALRLKDEIAARMKHLETLPKEQNPGLPFYETPSLSLTFGQIYFIRGQMEQAFEQLAKLTDPALDNEETGQTYRTGMRWYLAAAKKLNKLDQALYDRFVGQYPDEKEEIELLVNAVWF